MLIHRYLLALTSFRVEIAVRVVFTIFGFDSDSLVKLVEPKSNGKTKLWP